MCTCAVEHYEDSLVPRPCLKNWNRTPGNEATMKACSRGFSCCTLARKAFQRLGFHCICIQIIMVPKSCSHNTGG